MKIIRDKKDFAENFKNVRMKQNITQVELVEKLEGKIQNITQVIISKIETGTRKVQVTELVDFAEALEVPIEELLIKEQD